MILDNLLNGFLKLTEPLHYTGKGIPLSSGRKEMKTPHPCQCPYCDSTLLDFYHLLVSDDRPVPITEQSTACSSCGKEWVDVYVFSHREDQDGNKLEQKNDQ